MDAIIPKLNKKINLCYALYDYLQPNIIYLNSNF